MDKALRQRWADLWDAIFLNLYECELSESALAVPLSFACEDYWITREFFHLKASKSSSEFLHQFLQSFDEIYFYLIQARLYQVDHPQRLSLFLLCRFLYLQTEKLLFADTALQRPQLVLQLEKKVQTWWDNEKDSAKSKAALAAMDAFVALFFEIRTDLKAYQIPGYFEAPWYKPLAIRCFFSYALDWEAALGQMIGVRKLTWIAEKEKQATWEFEMQQGDEGILQACLDSLSMLEEKIHFEIQRVAMFMQNEIFMTKAPKDKIEAEIAKGKHFEGVLEKILRIREKFKKLR